MPINLPNLQANPVTLEDFPIVGAYVQGGHGTEVDFYNPRTETILPGEPVVVFGRIGISKQRILPGTFGTLVFGAVVSFKLDPEQASDINQGDYVYFDIDLEDAALMMPGYASGTQPTNGYRLGHAIGIIEKKGSISLATDGSAIAAKAGASEILVLMQETATTYGAVPNNLSTS